MGTTEIEQIDANIIREKWMNPVFVDFVFWYSIRVSNNKKYIISRLIEENISIFQCVTSSDIAWAVTCYVNNKLYWDTMVTTNGSGGGEKTTQKKTKLAVARQTRASAKNQEKNLEEDDVEEGMCCHPGNAINNNQPKSFTKIRRRCA